MSWILLLVGLVAGLAVGYTVGRAGGHARGRAAERAETHRTLEEITRTVAAGRVPEEADGELAALVAALEEGWAPRDAERQQALREALGRVTRFLEETVRKPLGGGRDAGGRPAAGRRRRVAARRAPRGLHARTPLGFASLRAALRAACGRIGR